VLRRVRDPFAVAEVLGAAGIPVPEVRDDPGGLPRDGSWLVKPRASGGGIGIEPFAGQEFADPARRYYQRRVEGPSYSALFIGARDRATMVGVARQWVCSVPGRPFAYRGGIALWNPGPAPAARLAELGGRLAAAFGLVGWFGVDYVLQHGIPWPVEVNPRYTASVELHELAAGRPLVREHRAACEGHDQPAGEPPSRQRRPARAAAKWIVYASGRLVVPEIAADPPPMDGLDAFATVADVPAPGTIIEAGEPVMTLLARDSDAGACEARLALLRRTWSMRLGFDAD
jgi:predicted ATP-grasp superfamily ATP-dependent carboligase